MNQKAKDFINNNQFIKACEEAGIKPTQRQARKYLNRQGLAWKARSKMERTKTYMGSNK